jgi:NAD-dependent deacetylase sirtuin 2
MKSSQCKSVGFLTGAGVSTAAGIPDYRSAGGVYDTLRPEILTASESQQQEMRQNPPYAVSWDLFKANPLPFLELKRPFILGTANKQWKPTLSHWFFRLVHDKGLLTRIYTQNIDGLDHQTGIPAEKIVSIHGNISTISCEECKHGMPMNEFKKAMEEHIRDINSEKGLASPKVSTPIMCTMCEKPAVKPDVVLFGRSLPNRFSECCAADLHKLDLLFVTGTSLAVHPANQLPASVGPECVVVVVNNTPVGADMGIAYGQMANRDIFLQGSTDEVFLSLATGLGWLDQLEEYIADEDRANRIGSEA